MSASSFFSFARLTSGHLVVHRCLAGRKKRNKPSLRQRITVKERRQRGHGSMAGHWESVSHDESIRVDVGAVENSGNAVA